MGRFDIQPWAAVPIVVFGDGFIPLSKVVSVIWLDDLGKFEVCTDHSSRLLFSPMPDDAAVGPTDPDYQQSIL